MIWCSCNANTNDVMPPHSYVYQWDMNVSWCCGSLYVQACRHGPHALTIYGIPKYLSGLVCMQANLNLGNLTSSHFHVLNTQISNRNMPNMFPIVYLNENLRYCNENLDGVTKNPSFNPTQFGAQQKVTTWQQLHLHVDIITFKTFQIIFILNTNIPHLLRDVRLCSPCRAPKQLVWITVSPPVYLNLIVVSSSNSI